MNAALSFFFSFFILLTVSGVQASEPKERQFFQNYTKFSAQPTNPETWNKVAAPQKEKVYLLQKGDTLWDVSKVLFGDPEFWPKIWSLNSGTIYNPHEVLPQMSLHFFEGTVNAPPTVKIGSKEAKGPLETFPVISNGAPKTAQEIPSNFPSLPVLVTNMPPPTTTIEEAKHVINQSYHLRYMVSEFPLTSLGTLGDYDRQDFMASMGDKVDVQAEESLKDSAYCFVELVKKGNGYYIYKYLADAKIKESFSDSRYSLEIIQSQEPVPKNALLLAGSIPEIDLSQKQSGGAGPFKLFDTPPLMQTQMATLQNIFIVNGGRKEGLVPGISLQINSLAKNKRAHRAGEGLIVQSSDDFATLVITESNSEIKQGDEATASSGAASSANDAPLSID